MKLGGLIVALKQTYCGSMARKYMHHLYMKKTWDPAALNVAGQASFTPEKTLPQRTDRRSLSNTSAPNSRAKQSLSGDALIRCQR